MTMLNNIPRYPTTTAMVPRGIGHFLARLSRLIDRWVAAEIARRERQAARVALCSLEDRELKDIGICRPEIGDAVSATAEMRMRMRAQ